MRQVIYPPTLNGRTLSWYSVPVKNDKTPDLRYKVCKKYKGVNFKIINGSYVKQKGDMKMRYKLPEKNVSHSSEQLTFFDYVFMSSLILATLGAVTSNALGN